MYISFAGLMGVRPIGVIVDGGDPIIQPHDQPLSEINQPWMPSNGKPYFVRTHVPIGFGRQDGSFIHLPCVSRNGLADPANLQTFLVDTYLAKDSV